MHDAVRVVLSLGKQWTWCEVFCRDRERGELKLHRKAFPADVSLQTIMNDHFIQYHDWDHLIDEFCGPVLPPPRPEENQ
jgi:hypothetical protein